MTEELVDGKVFYFCDFCGDGFYDRAECKHHEKACRDSFEEP